MTQDEIIRMARDARCGHAFRKSGVNQKRSVYRFHNTELKRFAELIAAHVIEECAKICEEGTALTAFQSKDCYSYARNRAAAIRARSDKE